MHLLTKTLGTLAACGLLATGTANAETIQVNFGNTASTTANWNDFNNPDTPLASLTNLVNSTGVTTGVSLTMDDTDVFYGTDDRNSTPPSGDAALYFPEDVTSSYAYGLTRWAGRDPHPRAEMTFAGLDANLVYDFTFFALRADDGPNTSRLGDISATGANSANATIDGTHDGSEIVQLLGIAPTAGGEIVIAIDDIDGGDTNSFYYLNAASMTAVPEPGSLALLGLGGLMLIGRRRSRA